MAPTVNTRTLGNYLASLQASASPATTLVTQDLQVLSTAFFLTGADISKAGQTGQYNDLIGAPTIGSAAAQDVSYFALAASGVLANTALQPDDVGTAAYANVGDFAVASQGVKADTAVQQVRQGTKISIDNTDPLRPIVSFEGTAEGQVTAPADFTATGVADATTFLRGDNVWAVPPGGGGGGGQVETVGEGVGIDVDATDPENPIVSIQTGYLAAVATTGEYGDLAGKPNLFSGAYADLTGKPTLGTAAAADSTAFATSAQGGKADTALQPGADIPWADITGAPSFAAVATTGSYSDLSGLPTLFSGAYADLTGKPTLFSGVYADLSSKPTLGPAAAMNVGTASGTVAAGDDSRITGAQQTSQKNQPNGYVGLDASSRLPAVDGSQLTNLPTPVLTGYAQYYAGSTQNLTDYPVGTVLSVITSVQVPRNSAVAVYYAPSTDSLFTTSAGSNVLLAGTWRARGFASYSSVSTICQRVA